MKNKSTYQFMRMVATIVMICVLGSSLPMAGLSTVSAGNSGTAVLDFNGEDFGTTLNYGGSIKTTDTVALLADTSGVPEGFTDSVYAGGSTSYAATAVSFENPLDLSKVTSIKVRIYVPTYGATDGELRVIDTSESTNVGYKALTKPTSDKWCEIEMLPALQNGAITKNSDGYLERFIIAYRTKAAVTIYFDSIIIEYSDENYFVTEDTDVETSYEVAITSLEKVTYRSDGCWVVYMNYSGTLPQDYAYYVNITLDGTSTVTYQLWYSSDTRCYIGLFQHPSSYLTIEAGSLTCKDSLAPGVSLTEDFSLSCIDDKIIDYLPQVDTWTNISVTQAFGSTPVTLTQKIGSEISSFDCTEFKYTGAFLEDVESTEAKIFIGTDATNPWKYGLLFHLKRSAGTFSMYDWSSGTQTIMTNRLDSGTSVTLTDIYTDYTDTTPTGFKFRIQYVDGNVYALVFVEDHLAGVYCSEGTASTFGNRIFGYSGGDSGSYYVQSYVNNNYWEAAIETIDSDSRVNGDKWEIYPRPANPASVPGTSWSTKFLDVVYEVDGESYTVDLVRAADSEGLYMPVSGTILNPVADGVTVVIKAGKYLSNDGSEGIYIPEDFTFYVIDGTLTTEFDFDDPSFTSAVYCNVDSDSYTVVDADTVTIDGVTYSKGDVYTNVGVHTLTYTMYNREYSRQLIIYRYGDLNDDDTISVVDLIRLKKNISEDSTVELTASSELGADMNSDATVNDIDMKLLREYLILSQGILLLSPENSIVAALASDEIKTMETNYSPGMSSSIETDDDIYHRSAVKIDWLSKKDVDEYKVLLAMVSDFSDAVTYTTVTTTLSLINLIPATTYYWKLVAGDYETEVRTFYTEDTVRTITIDGVSNVRDCGGYDALDGKTVKYGMIYRGGTLDEITEDGLYQMLNVLGMKTDLDLRVAGEGSAGSGSPLGDAVNYLNYSGPYYWSNLINETYKEALVSEIRAYANEENYPIYVHCSVGRDRTGTILLLINGLLGVSKADLYLDYELSFLYKNDVNDSAKVESHIANFTTMYDGIQTYAPEGTFADACEAFMLGYCGITQDEIDTIRLLLTE